MIGGRRLIFHFFVNANWKSNPIYAVHAYFLKKYSHIFDDAVFIISVDDVNDRQLIEDAEKFLIECGFKSITFKVEENSRFYEVETFNKYIVQHMDTLNGLTFFGHVKGITDYYNPNMDREAILLWVASLYYLGLEFYKEAEWAAYTAQSCFFGGPMMLYDKNSDIYLPKNLFMYSGSFYWINCKEVYKRFNGQFPDIINRYYVEHFPGNLCESYGYEAYSHNYMMVDRSKIKEDMFISKEVAQRCIGAVLEETEMGSFMAECDKLKKYLTDNGITY